jgi:hypothetical protein
VSVENLDQGGRPGNLNLGIPIHGALQPRCTFFLTVSVFQWLISRLELCDKRRETGNRCAVIFETRALSSLHIPALVLLSCEYDVARLWGDCDDARASGWDLSRVTKAKTKNRTGEGVGFRRPTVQHSTNANHVNTYMHVNARYANGILIICESF